VLATDLEQYKRIQIETAPGPKLIVMLYDCALRNLEKAREAMVNGKREQVTPALNKVHDALGELSGSLNFDAGEIAGRLFELYEYCGWRLVQANLKRDPNALDAVREILATLRSAWVECAKNGAGRKAAPAHGFQAVAE